MAKVWVRVELACTDRSCAPPPVGTGGTNTRKSSNPQAAGSGMSGLEAFKAKRAKEIAETQRLIEVERAARESRSFVSSGDKQIGNFEVGGSGRPLTENVLREAYATFIPIGRNPETFSGWKAHVYADDVEGVANILRRLEGEIATNQNPGGWGAKVATQRFLDHPQAAPGKTQHGKAVTIYFPRKADVEKDLKHLQRLMADLPQRQHKPVTSEEYLSNGVSKRYELRDDAPPGDLDPQAYQYYYKAAD